ncbi:unnamed protein product [Dracunculus medinensis]|uniref:Uncharacterized protein n=1 Tax=Dracunculus medinensis TaxID=318479 RepID=A0A0N4U2W2_DRAME|nr:unnamed protein product [Dracunculus medinensis]
MGSSICPQLFTWECEEMSCCESYRFRVLILFASIGFLLAALIVAAIWLSFEFRPAYRKRLRQTEISGQHPRSDLEMRSFEEAKYLRRMSQNK